MFTGEKKKLTKLVKKSMFEFVGYIPKAVKEFGT